jgi:hypothetical protein
MRTSTPLNVGTRSASSLGQKDSIGKLKRLIYKLSWQ